MVSKVILCNISLSYYLVGFAGAYVLYIFRAQTTGIKSLKVLGLFFCKWNENPLLVFFDSLLISCIGAFICTVISQPTNYQQAIIYGLGWTGIVESFTSIKEHE
jgi:hypothetical protein